jgi:exodeoxyribonuclease-3
MKLACWNVNGIRAAIGHGFLSYLSTEGPDIIGLQEVKATEDQCPALLDFQEMNYTTFWNSANKKGYSGTAILSRPHVLRVTYGLGMPEHDEEGRIITVEYENFYFVTVYTPNSKRELERLDYRQLWDSLFLDYMRRLEALKPVIFCGDLNVAHTPIDHAHPKQNEKNAGYTIEERNGFQAYIDAGFIDTFRFLHPDTVDAYTWWSNFSGARGKNIGWRIDYFMVS